MGNTQAKPALLRSLFLQGQACRCTQQDTGDGYKAGQGQRGQTAQSLADGAACRQNPAKAHQKAAPGAGCQAGCGVKAFPACRAAEQRGTTGTCEHPRRQCQPDAGLAPHGQLQVEQALGNRPDKAQRGELGGLKLIDTDMRGQPPAASDQQSYDMALMSCTGLWRNAGRSRAKTNSITAGSSASSKVLTEGR